MIKLLLTSVFAFALTPIFSQQNAVATGGNASGPGGTVSYSVGQIDYSSASGTEGNSNEGVQQPFEFYDATAGVPFESIDISLYPNPTNDAVIFHMDVVTPGTQFWLSDAKGKIVDTGNVTTEETKLDMQHLSSGVYQLHIQNTSTTTSTIKIVKN